LTALKPGWAESFGRQHPGDTDDFQRLRERGRRPFAHNGWGQKDTAVRGGKKSAVGRGGKRTLDKLLGPVEEE